LFLTALFTKKKFAVIPIGFKFSQTLNLSQSSIEIRYLQIILNSDPDTKLADSGPGSKDQETEYFGPLTKAAIIKFQEKYKK
jgi:peptidoglycan hydrolase-like protein with peptidoglycan-binding domain